MNNGMNTSLTDPNYFLDMVNKISPAAAVLVANEWREGSTPSRTRAAASLMERQTVFPVCERCKWAIVDYGRHECYSERNSSPQTPVGVTHYRATKITRLGYGDNRDTMTCVWQGRGADALSADHPVLVIDGHLVDPLGRWTDLKAGSTTTHSFEMWVVHDDGGAWEPCDDPRSMSPEVRKAYGTHLIEVCGK